MTHQQYFSDDIGNFLYLLRKYNIKYLIVGGEAVIYYGYARLTGTTDIFFEPTTDNSKSLFAALNEFWDNDIPGVRTCDELLIKDKDKEDLNYLKSLPPEKYS